MRSKSFSSRHFSRGMQISESSVKMLLHHSTSIFTFGVKQNHKTVDWLRLNETSGHPPSCSSRATCLPRTMPRQFLSISSDGDSTTFLGKLSTAQISSQISNVQRKLPVFQSFAFFFCPWVPLWAWVHFLCTLPSGSLARSSLSIHSDLPAYLADFVQSEPELGRGDLWILTNFLSPPFSPRTQFNELLPIRSWERPKYISWSLGLWACLSLCTQDLELPHLMVIVAKAAFDIPIPRDYFLAGEHEVRETVSVVFSISQRTK